MEHNHHHSHELPTAGQGQAPRHSDAFLAHAMTPQNVGIIPQPDGFAHPKGSCGDYIDLYLKVQDDAIADARFMTEGCAHTVACGSALTSLVKGLPVDRALKEITPARLEEELGGLEREHRHCAALAVAALRGAVRDYFKKRQAPWKKPYQKTQ